MSPLAIARVLLVLLTLPLFACDDERRANSADSSTSHDEDSEPNETEDASDGDACVEDCSPRPDSGVDQLAEGIVGSACDDDTVCGEGRCMLSERITGVAYPDGYCTGRCRDDAQCGERGYCAPGFRGAVGSCMLRCERDADCDRKGYRCRVSGMIGRCMPGPEPLPEGVVGKACSSDETCGGAAMSCASSLIGVAAPGGYCSARCSLDADCSSAGACVSGLGTAPLPIGTCFARCEPPGGCREGYTCNALSEIVGDRGGLCVPMRSGANP